MNELVVATTVAPFKARSEEATQWIENAEAFVEDSLESFSAVRFFAAIELDSSGKDVFKMLMAKLDEMNSVQYSSGDYWFFSIDDGTKELNPINRLHRICAGRNMIHEYALRNKKVSHVLFLDSDLRVPTDSAIKLRQVYRPVVGGDVPVYCRSGKAVEGFDFPVQEHWNTAGFLLVERRVLTELRWRANTNDDHLSDDPCFALDVDRLGFGKTWVRKDVVGKHKVLRDLRDRGHDLRISHE
jgi:hypothetical protein